MDKEYQMLTPGEMVIDPKSDEYETAPDGEMLQGHVASVKKIEADNFDRTGKETKLVVGIELDEDIPGQGQVYSQWFTPSLNPKSNLSKLVVAIFGEIKAFDPVTDLLGMPLRFSLKNVEKDGTTRQYLDGYFKPVKEQKRKDVKNDPDLGSPVADMTTEEFDNLIGSGE